MMKNPNDLDETLFMKERQTSSHQPPSDIQQKKWTIFFLVATAIFMSTLDSSIVNVALPAIMRDFRVPLATISWVLVGYLLTVSALLLSFGRLSDIKGRRWVYCRGFFIFTVGSLLCSVSPGAGWLIAARICQATGAAMLMACSPAMVVDAFPMAERGRVLGLVGMVVAAGLTSGPALGGVLLNMLSWRAIFYLNIPIGVVATLRAARILKGGLGDIGQKAPFDWKGAILLACCFCAFILAMTHAAEWGIDSLRTVSVFGISIVCAVWAYRTENKTDSPVFHPGLLRNRLFILPVASSLILFSGLFFLIFLMPFYLVDPAGFLIDRAGYMMIIPFVFLFIISPLSGMISDRIGSRLLCTIGMMILSIGLYALSGLTPGATAFTIGWRLALCGIGTAAFISPNTSIAMGSVQSDQRGLASGTIATARNLGMVVGVAFAGLIFNTIFRKLNGGKPLTVYGPELQQPFMVAFRWAMMTGSVVAAIGMVIAFLRGPEEKDEGSKLSA
jgi:EmrB/QacA subfamily drug resistance transporter